MKIEFHKYQGAGNDFIFLDNFSGRYDDLTVTQIQLLCDRKFGIGSDGLIKIDKSDAFDFVMDFYNPDGSKSFCGNGARCATRFVINSILRKDEYQFEAIDGLHEAHALGGNISLSMRDVQQIETVNNETYILNTGSPHYVHFVEDVENMDLYEYGRSIRYNARFRDQGINVNIVQVIKPNLLSIRTYERGVENETLACGTGITAAAIAYVHQQKWKGEITVHLKAKGGDLSVAFYAKEEGGYTSIRLIGPATYVFSGEIDV